MRSLSQCLSVGEVLNFVMLCCELTFEITGKLKLLFKLAKINIPMLYWGAVHNTQVLIVEMLPERVFLRDEVPGGKKQEGYTWE